MMPHFQVVEAKIHHCGKMVRRLRSEHARAIAGLGVDPHLELINIYSVSAFKRAWLIDGELAALGGVSGALISPYGYVWLALSNLALRYPLAVIKEARRQLDQIMLVKRELATTVIGDDVVAQRFAIFLGFHVEHGGRGSPALSRFLRRDFSSYLGENADLRKPYGNGYIFQMGYHKDEAA
jgi:hypothetical protein